MVNQTCPESELQIVQELELEVVQVALVHPVVTANDPNGVAKPCGICHIQNMLIMIQLAT